MKNLSIVVISGLICLSAILYSVSLPSKLQISYITSPPAETATDHISGVFPTNARSAFALVPGSRHSLSALFSKGNNDYSRYVDEYIAKFIADTPYEERARRITELAGLLYAKNYRDRARNLLESLVFDSVSTGDTVPPDALNLLREIYSSEGSKDGYERLLAVIPESYPQRQEMVHNAVLLELDRGELGRAYSLLTAEIENNTENEDPDIGLLAHDLSLVYEVTGKPLMAGQERSGTALFPENPLLYYVLGKLYLAMDQEVLAQEAFENAVRLSSDYAGVVPRGVVHTDTTKGGG